MLPIVLLHFVHHKESCIESAAEPAATLLWTRDARDFVTVIPLDPLEEIRPACVVEVPVIGHSHSFATLPHLGRVLLVESTKKTSVQTMEGEGKLVLHVIDPDSLCAGLATGAQKSGLGDVLLCDLDRI